MKKIKIKGAREHNLKNVSLELPREKFVVITGISGSGKSTLAFDTLYAEGQRSLWLRGVSVFGSSEVRVNVALCGALEKMK